MESANLQLQSLITKTLQQSQDRFRRHTISVLSASEWHRSFGGFPQKHSNTSCIELRINKGMENQQRDSASTGSPRRGGGILISQDNMKYDTIVVGIPMMMVIEPGCGVAM